MNPARILGYCLVPLLLVGTTTFASQVVHVGAITTEEISVTADGSETCSETEQHTAGPEDDANGEYEYIAVPWGEAQKVTTAVEEETAWTYEVIETTYWYMTEHVLVEEEYEDIRDACVLHNSLCSYWASMGECDENPIYMDAHCAPACQTCSMISFARRCPFDEKLEVLEVNDLNRMFFRIIQDYDFEILHRDPWVAQLDNFLTDEECDRLIALGDLMGYERSEDADDTINPDGSTNDGVISDERTSYNSWCEDECEDDEITQNVTAKMENLSGIPRSHYEYMQMLRYNVGEFYGIHHDYIDMHYTRPQGVRVLTIFLYLNDVEEGGGTNFSELNLTVTPKKGRAVIWPSVLNESPHDRDERTEHQALPVLKGIKYGANVWIHQRDFRTPDADGCT